MNTTATTKIAAAIALFAVAAAAALVGGVATEAKNEKKVEIVKLERVVVAGKRAQQPAVVIAQLPRVVITGRSTPAADAEQAGGLRLAAADNNNGSNGALFKAKAL